MLTGLWHGDSFNFILWGLYYGILLILEKKVFDKWLDNQIEVCVNQNKNGVATLRA